MNVAATCRTGFAPDPALPGDLLLDEDEVGARLARWAGRDGPIAVDSCSLVRAKYRIGESLRVVYRIVSGNEAHVLTARAFTAGASAAAYRKAGAVAVTTGALRPVVHDAELDAVWWAFPNDRRMVGLARVLRPPPAVAALAGPAVAG